MLLAVRESYTEMTDVTRDDTTPFLKFVDAPDEEVETEVGGEAGSEGSGERVMEIHASSEAATEVLGGEKRASKADLIASIRARSRGVGTDYLMKFEEPALRNYLDRLLGLSGPRGAKAVWVRRAETPAIVVRRVWPRRGLMPAS